MPQIVFPEFRDSTRGTKYPFIDEATLTSNGANNTPKITLPNDIFIDVSIFVPGTRLHVILMSIIVTKTKVQLQFGGAGNTCYCTGVIDKLQDITDEDITIPLYSSKRTGTLVMNKLKLAYFRGLALGTYIFNPDKSARLVPSCIITVPKLGVNSIAVNERNTENTVSGKVWLIGHDGVLLRTKDNDPNSIRIDVVGDALYKKAALGVDTYEYAKPIRSINGMPADEFGGFKITTLPKEDALRVRTGNDGITLFISGAVNGN